MARRSGDAPDPGHFEAMYGAAPDPWHLAERAYDLRKYAITTASLPRERYASAFEPACSVGVLTRMLAERCDRLLACDLSQVAVDQARARCADLPWVTVDRRVLPAEWPTASGSAYDLIVLSEFLYYLDDADFDGVLDHTTRSLAEGGTLAAVHWRPHAREHVRPAPDVHEALRRRPGLVHLVEHREPDFLLDVFVAGSGSPASMSPAAAEGLR
ncbi:SAM-dependent methyltransferase [Streptodolium elevatio]|uniref:SAM-dependent methyltransferase n=1 Tax=Streptodolium elevatio TaxID=3157996 RepID=A0ABV3DJR1_9ACTN